MSKNKFIFNKYKTKYGSQQNLIVPEELSNVIKDYIYRWNITDSLLELENENSLNYQIQKIFNDNYDENKVITTNILKESYLKYVKRKKIAESEEEFNEIKNKMGIFTE
jgi:hypothetical protein